MVVHDFVSDFSIAGLSYHALKHGLVSQLRAYWWRTLFRKPYPNPRYLAEGMGV